MVSRSPNGSGHWDVYPKAQLVSMVPPDSTSGVESVSGVRQCYMLFCTDTQTLHLVAARFELSGTPLSDARCFTRVCCQHWPLRFNDKPDRHLTRFLERLRNVSSSFQVQTSPTDRWHANATEADMDAYQLTYAYNYVLNSASSQSSADIRSENYHQVRRSLLLRSLD